MLKVYDYEKAYLFIRDAWKEKKKKNTSFSLRAWSKKLGFENNAPLSLMIAGKRPIPKKYIPLFIRDLELSASEGLYLETLIEFDRSKDEEMRQFYYKRLQELSPQNEIKFREIELCHFFQDPIHFILLEATQLKNFKHDDIHWIRENLFLDTTLAEVETVLKRLEALGFLEKRNRRYHRIETHLISSRDIPSAVLKKFHENNALTGSKAVYEQSVNEREFNGFMFNIDPKEMDLIKKDIRNFIDSLMQRYEKPFGEGVSTYQLNSHFFRVFGKSFDFEIKKEQ